MKRPLFAAITGIGLVSLLLTLVVSLMFLDHATTHAGGIGDSGVPKHQNSMNKVATTINALTHIAIVGSTAFIVDGKGHTISVDSNPYGVAIAPPSTPRSNIPGTLQAGDIVVNNFGGNNTGKTLVRFPAKKGPGHLFNTMANPGTNGPSASRRCQRHCSSIHARESFGLLVLWSFTLCCLSLLLFNFV